MEEKKKDIWRLEQKAREERQLLLKGEERCELSGLLTWKYKNKNNLMYLAGSSVPLTAAEEASLLGPEKEIKHANTRLDSDQAATAFGASAREHDRRRAGHPRALLGDLHRDYLMSPARASLGGSGSPSDSGSPKVNGYGFVCTPEPHAGAMEASLASWGDVASTPVPMPRVSAADRTGAAYRIPATPTRDKVAMELAEKSSRRAKHAKDQNRRGTPSSVRSPYTPAFATPRGATTPLSPAAVRLLSIRRGRKTPGSSVLGALAHTPLRPHGTAQPRPSPASTPRPGW